MRFLEGNLLKIVLRIIASYAAPVLLKATLGDRPTGGEGLGLVVVNRLGPLALTYSLRYVKDRMLKDRLTTEQGHYILKTDKRQNADVA